VPGRLGFVFICILSDAQTRNFGAFGYHNDYGMRKGVEMPRTLSMARLTRGVDFAAARSSSRQEGRACGPAEREEMPRCA
jgi:hypothetical protein